MRCHRLLAISVALCVFLLDFGTKWLVTTRMTEFQEIHLIPGLFALQVVHNPGAAFGVLANQQWLFISVSLVAVGAILYYIPRPEARVGLVPWALGMLLGGTVGNLLDRIRHGKVVDFFLLYWKHHTFPNFNVADLGITAGVGLFILYLAITGEKKAA
jgi:signal peptidase II